MPHCCAFGCNNQLKNKKEDSITFHRLPGEGRKQVRAQWITVIGRPQKNLPKHVYLCSSHFDPSCFDESANIRYKLLVFCSKKRLEPDAVPTMFTHKPGPKECTTSVARAAKHKRQEVKKSLI